jgi:hypothetical protein
MSSEFDSDAKLEARGSAGLAVETDHEAAGRAPIALESEPTLYADGPRYLTQEDRDDRRSDVRRKFADGKLITLAAFKKKYGL